MLSSNTRSLRCLTLLVLLAACKDQADSPVDSGLDDTGGTEEASGGTSADEDAPASLGNPTGEPQRIDHETAVSIAVNNVVAHLDGLEASLAFLEESVVLQNAWSLWMENEDEEDADGAESSEKGFEIDLSEVRDDLVEILEERLMVAETATVAEDGLSLRYAVDPALLCADEEQPGSPEEAEEQAEDEADCVDRFSSSPLAFELTTDGPGRLDLSVQVGSDAAEFVALQLHADVIAPFLEMGGFTRGLEAIFDLDMPAVAEGRMAFEVRREGRAATSARFAVQEDIEVGDDTSTLGWSVASHAAPGSLSIDGEAETVEGSLDLGRVEVVLPWTPDGDGDQEDKRLQIDVPAVRGAVAYDGTTDVFSLEDGGLGDAATRAAVDGDVVLEMNLNPTDGRAVSAVVTAPSEDDVQVDVTPALDLEMTFAMHKVAADFEDLPTALADDTVGVVLEGEEGGALRTWTTDDGTAVQVAAGELTLWSASRDKDIVVEAGACIGSEESHDGPEDLWGDLVSEECQP